MKMKFVTALQAGIIFLSLNQNAQSNDVCCDRYQKPTVTCAEVALPIMLGTAFVQPFVAGFGYVSSSVAGASAGLNTFGIPVSVLNTWISWHMDTHVRSTGGYFQGQTCGAVPMFSTIRNALGLGLGIGATTTAFIYYYTGDEKMWAVNVTLTTVKSVLDIAGTSGMYACLFPKFKNDNSEKMPLV